MNFEDEVTYSAGVGLDSFSYPLLNLSKLMEVLFEGETSQILREDSRDSFFKTFRVVDDGKKSWVNELTNYLEAFFWSPLTVSIGLTKSVAPL